MNARLDANIRAIEKFVAEHDRRLVAAAPSAQQPPKPESSQSDS